MLLRKGCWARSSRWSEMAVENAGVHQGADESWAMLSVQPRLVELTKNA